jgi:hypothetical protein
MNQNEKNAARSAELEGLTGQAQSLQEGYDNYNIRPIVDLAEETVALIKSKGLAQGARMVAHADEAHLDFMLEQMRLMTDISKVNRWLGYIQGVAVCLYSIELETLKDLNRGRL